MLISPTTRLPTHSRVALYYLADKLMPGNSAEARVSFQDLAVGAANSSQNDADER